MTTPDQIPHARSYGCTFGCGNPFDFVVISVSDGTAEFLCLPCYVHLATDMVTAVVDPSDPKVRETMANLGQLQFTAAPGPAGRTGKRNAPVTETDPGVIESFDSEIDDDE